MKRRDAIRLIGFTGAALTTLPVDLFSETFEKEKQLSQEEIDQIFKKLKDEPAAQTEVRVERGGSRLFLNNNEVYLMLALSVGMSGAMDEFSEGGINFFAPIRKLSTIVGILLISVIIPPVATAPAPIYLIYLVQISDGAISFMSRVVSG